MTESQLSRRDPKLVPVLPLPLSLILGKKKRGGKNLFILDQNWNGEQDPLPWPALEGHEDFHLLVCCCFFLKKIKGVKGSNNAH